MIKVYQVSRRYIMLFMHNNKYLPLTGLLYLHRTMVNLQLNNHSISKLGEFWRRILSYIMILFLRSKTQKSN